MDIRVAIVGYGLAGEVFHAPLIAATPGMQVAAVVTGDSGRAQRARARYPAAQILPSADDLWARPRDVDLVVLGTPNPTHVPLTLEALAHGLPVVVDKPFAASVADARSVVDDARRRGLLLTVFQNRRWDGDFLTVQKLVAEGTLGGVTRFESRFERWRPMPRTGWRESADPRDAGGVLFDLGPHVIDQALQLFGPARLEHAELDRRRPNLAVPDDVFLALEHASGVRSHLWVSAVAPQSGPRFHVKGSRAVFTKYGLDPQEVMLKDGARPGDAGYGEDAESAWGIVADSDGRMDRVPTLAGRYGAFYQGVVGALRDGTPPPVDPEGSIAGLAIIEEAMRIARD
jgi:predicted dehydrogenase